MAYQSIFQMPQQNSLFGVADQGTMGYQAPAAGFGIDGMNLPQAAGASPWSMESIFGGNGKAGWGNTAVGAASGLMSGFMGMQNYGLAKKQLAFQKQAFEKNLANQTKATNTALEDRQRARVAANSGGYQSVSDYMREHGV